MGGVVQDETKVAEPGIGVQLNNGFLTCLQRRVCRGFVQGASFR